MTSNEAMVKTITSGWKLVNDRLDKVFASYSDSELQREVAPHRDRVYYLLGRLTVAHDRLLPLLRLGDRLHPELEEEFFANPDRAFPDPVVWPAQLREAWSQVNKQLQAGIETLTVDQWLEGHASISPEEFVRASAQPTLCSLNQTWPRHAARGTDSTGSLNQATASSSV